MSTVADNEKEARMFKKYALQAPADGEGEGGGGAPADESLKDGEVKKEAQKDAEKTISESQLKAILRSANEKYERVAGELAELKAQSAAKPADPQKRYTKAELNAAVQANQITQDQADEISAKQLREEIKAEVTAEVLGAVKADRSVGRVTADLAEYKRLAPEIMDEGNETRQRIADEFATLVDSGLPQNLTTEFAAIRAVLGPVEKLRIARSARRGEESHEESGGGGSGESRGHGSGKKEGYDALPAERRAHYDRLIAAGIYKDKAAVNAELKFASPRRRAVPGARA